MQCKIFVKEKRNYSLIFINEREYLLNGFFTLKNSAWTNPQWLSLVVEFNLLFQSNFYKNIYIFTVSCSVSLYNPESFSFLFNRQQINPNNLKLNLTSVVCLVFSISLSLVSILGQIFNWNHYIKLLNCWLEIYNMSIKSLFNSLYNQIITITFPSTLLEP